MARQDSGRVHQLRSTLTADEADRFIGSADEVVVDRAAQALRVHDGRTKGGRFTVGAGGLVDLDAVIAAVLASLSSGDGTLVDQWQVITATTDGQAAFILTEFTVPAGRQLKIARDGVLINPDHYNHTANTFTLTEEPAIAGEEYYAFLTTLTQG